jgi:hypothetical protein
VPTFGVDDMASGALNGVEKPFLGRFPAGVVPRPMPMRRGVRPGVRISIRLGSLTELRGVLGPAVAFWLMG